MSDYYPQCVLYDKVARLCPRMISAFRPQACRYFIVPEALTRPAVGAALITNSPLPTHFAHASSHLMNGTSYCSACTLQWNRQLNACPVLCGWRSVGRRGHLADCNRSPRVGEVEFLAVGILPSDMRPGTDITHCAPSRNDVLIRCTPRASLPSFL
jgi:hypothetical protein